MACKATTHGMSPAWRRRRSFNHLRTKTPLAWACILIMCRSTIRKRTRWRACALRTRKPRAMRWVTSIEVSLSRSRRSRPVKSVHSGTLGSRRWHLRSSSVSISSSFISFASSLPTSLKLGIATPASFRPFCVRRNWSSVKLRYPKRFPIRWASPRRARR
jgi:hypothetical protein